MFVKAIFGLLILSIFTFVCYCIFGFLFNDAFNHTIIEGTVLSAPMGEESKLYVLVESGGKTIHLTNTLSVMLSDKEDPLVIQQSLVEGRRYRFVVTGYSLPIDPYQNIYQVVDMGD